MNPIDREKLEDWLVNTESKIANEATKYPDDKRFHYCEGQMSILNTLHSLLTNGFFDRKEPPSPKHQPGDVPGS